MAILKDQQSLQKLDELVTEMEIVQEKAQVITGDLVGGYFDFTENEKAFIQFYHHNAGVKSNISLDYVCKMRELIDSARNLLNSVWDTLKAQEQKESEDKEKSPQSPK